MDKWIGSRFLLVTVAIYSLQYIHYNNVHIWSLYTAQPNEWVMHIVQFYLGSNKEFIFGRMPNAKGYVTNTVELLLSVQPGSWSCPNLESSITRKRYTYVLRCHIYILAYFLNVIEKMR